MISQCHDKDDSIMELHQIHFHEKDNTILKNMVCGVIYEVSQHKYWKWNWYNTSAQLYKQKVLQ